MSDNSGSSPFVTSILIAIFVLLIYTLGRVDDLYDAVTKSKTQAESR